MTDTGTQKNTRKKRLLPWWGWTLIGVGLVLVVLFIAVRITAATSLGRGILESQLESRVIQGQEVEIDGLEGDLLGRITIDKLTLRDTDGIWGEGSDLVLDWSPWSLVGKKLTIDAFEAGDISVFRRPILPETEPKTSEGGSPLKGVELSRLLIERVYLEEGVVPQTVAGSIQGDVSWTPEAADTNLRIEPESEGGDRLIADVNWAENEPLRGTAELDGPAGGLFATLLQLAPEQAINMTFSAEGERSSVSARLDARINQADWLNFELNAEDEREVFEGRLDLTLHPELAPIAQQLGARIDFLGDFSLDEPVESLNLMIRSELATLEISDASQSADSQSVHVRLNAFAPNRLLKTDQVSLEAFRAEGDVSVRDDIILFDGSVLAQDVETAQARISQIAGPLQVRFGENRVELTPEFRADDLVLTLRESPSRIAWLNLEGEISYDLETSGLSVAELNLATPQSRVNATGRTTISGNLPTDLKGQIRLNLPEFGLYDAGVLTGEWAAIRGAQNSSRFSVDIRGTGLADTEELYGWLGETVRLRMEGNVSDEGAVNVPRLGLSLASGNLTGSLNRATNGRLIADTEFHTSDSYPLVDMIPGAILKMRAEGQTDDLSLNGSFEAVTIAAGGAELVSPRLQFDGRFAEQVLNGALAVTGQLENDPLNVRTNISLDGQNWSVDDLQGYWRELNLTGDFRGLGGDLEELVGEAHLVGDLPEGLPAKGVDLTAFRQKGNLKITGLVEDVNSGPLTSASINLDVSGTVERADYAFDINGLLTVSEVTQEADIALSGEVVALLEDVRSTSGVLNVLWGSETISTREPFRLSQSEKGVEGTVSLDMFDGGVDVELLDAPERRVDLSIFDIKMARILQALGRAPLDGSLQMDLQLQENGEQLIGQLDGRFNDLAWPERDMTPISYLMTGELENESLNVRIVTPDGQDLAADIRVDYPLTTQANPLAISPATGRTGDLSAKLIGPVDNVLALVLPEEMILQGRINAEIASVLPLQPDALTGQVNFSDGYFEHGELGAVFQDIGFDIAIADQTLLLQQFSALGRDGGTLNGQGSLGLVNQSGSNLEIRADQLIVADRREGRAVATGTLGLEVEDDAFLVIGDLTLDEGQIYIDRLPTSSNVTTLDVQFEEPVRTETTASSGAAAGDASGPREVRLDIALNAPRRLRVNGSGMDAEMSLASRITGTPSNIAINGESKIVRGRFELLGKRFDFVDSTIRFAGDPMAARLDIEAQRNTGEFLAKVQITGTPMKPEVTLDAEPSLPEDEVLSRVLFGRSPSQLTGLEAARLAAALATMGGGGGFDLMGGLENLAGLDTLDVSQDASGQFMVATGRYLSEDVYLEVTSNASGSPGVSVEWEARDNVSVGAETVPGQGQNFTIQWKRDFD